MGAVVAYGLGRTIVVWQALGGYGVNPWVYGAIDLVSSVPYGLGTARVVTGVLDRDWARVRRWGTIAALAFVAPDVYIVFAGESMPWPVYVVLGAWCSVAAVFAFRSLRRQVRERKAGLPS